MTPVPVSGAFKFVVDDASIRTEAQRRLVAQLRLLDGVSPNRVLRRKAAALMRSLRRAGAQVSVEGGVL